MNKSLKYRVTALFCILVLMLFSVSCSVLNKDNDTENEQSESVQEEAIQFDGDAEVMAAVQQYISDDIAEIQKGIAYANIDGEWVRIPSQYTVTANRITRLEFIEEITDIGDYPIEIYALEYALKADNDDKVILAGDMTMDEEGFFTTLNSKPYLIILRSEPAELLGSVDEKMLTAAEGDWKKVISPFMTVGDVQKYMDYFASRAHVSPLMDNYVQGQGFSDSALLAFAISNIADYSYDIGATKQQIDDVLMKYFGKTVTEYVPWTNVTEYVPDSNNERIRDTGWTHDAIDYMMLDSLTVNSDGSISAIFDRYVIFPLDDFVDIKAEILEGKGGYIKTDSINVVFKEKTDENGELYLEYISMDRVTSTQDESLKAAEYDASLEVTSDEFVLSNKVALGMIYEDVEKLLGGFDEVYNDVGNMRSCEKLGYIYGFTKFDEATASEDDPDLPHDGKYYLTYISAGNKCIDELPRGIKIGDSVSDVLDKIPSHDSVLKEWKYQSIYGPYTYKEDVALAYLEYNTLRQAYRLLIQTPQMQVMNLLFDEDNKLVSFEMLYE